MISAVVCTISSRRKLHDPANRMIWIIDHEGPFSIDGVQEFIDANGTMLEGFKARYVCARFKDLRGMFRWMARKERVAGRLIKLTGWNGPIRIRAMP